MRVGIALLAVAAALCGVFGAPAAAQEGALGLQVISVSGDAFPYAKAVVAIEDQGGETPPLGAEQFRVTVDGAPAPVQSAELASSDAAPLDALVVFDTSGSMEGAPLAAAKAAAHALIAELGPQDRVAVMEFGDEVRLLQDYTADRAALAVTIDGLVAAGNTALYQATADAAARAAASTAARRVVVLLSDGADFGGRSRATREEATTAAANSGVPFFTIAQGTDLDRPYLESIAGITRGRFLEAPSPGDLEALYAGIGRLLRSQYVVLFDASGAPASDVTVEISVDAGGRTASAASALHLDAAFAPQLIVEGIAPGDSVAAEREVRVTTETGVAPTRVRWYVDGAQVFESVAAPFVYRYDPREAGAGARTMRVEADFGPIMAERAIEFSAAPAASGGGGFPLAPIAAVAAVLVIGAAGAWWFVNRRRKGGAPAAEHLAPLTEQMKAAARRVVIPQHATETPEAEAIGEPMGVLISRSGSDIGREYLVGGRPVSIGFGALCGVRVDDPELATEEARIWVRGGNLLVHRMTRLSVIAANGVSGGWVILEPGDTFDIGAHRFEFKLLPAGAPAPEAEAAPEPAAVPKRERKRKKRPEAPPAVAELPSNVIRMADLMPKTDGGFTREDREQEAS